MEWPGRVVVGMLSLSLHLWKQTFCIPYRGAWVTTVDSCVYAWILRYVHLRIQATICVTRMGAGKIPESNLFLSRLGDYRGFMELLDSWFQQVLLTLAVIGV